MVALRLPKRSLTSLLFRIKENPTKNKSSWWLKICVKNTLNLVSKPHIWCALVQVLVQVWGHHREEKASPGLTQGLNLNWEPTRYQSRRTIKTDLLTKQCLTSAAEKAVRLMKAKKTRRRWLRTQLELLEMTCLMTLLAQNFSSRTPLAWADKSTLV